MLTALLLSFSLAAPGDVEAILATPVVELDGPGKTKLGAAVIAVFPGAELAAVRNYNCDTASEGRELRCDGMYMDRVTEAEFIDLSIAGKVGKAFDTAPEGFVDFLRHAPKKVVDAVAKPVIEIFVEAVFTGVSVGLINDFRCERTREDDTKIRCRCSYYDTVSEATYVTLVHLKSVVRPIRRVE